jgi:D-lactate dehydrogenase
LVDYKARTVLGEDLVKAVPEMYSPHAVAEHTVALMLTLNRNIHCAYIVCATLNGLIGFETGKIGALL